ncbi:MAG: aromatic-ring-hydroxylating dioxygenase subunit beta [Pseudomonadota bacterium]|nr:aromatic-ring-hydroxylating dioxygenase subunit beta [Pseudomonadota bacterium]
MNQINPQLTLAVTAFLNLEADMLDNKEYHDWLELWNDDGFYIVPVDHDVTDYSAAVNVAYDDKEMRELRVARLTSGDAVSTVGAEKTVRTVSGVRVLSEDNNLIAARYKYCLFENNKNGIRQFPATVEVKLSPLGDTFKIVEKVVKVMKSAQHLTTINYLF